MSDEASARDRVLDEIADVERRITVQRAELSAAPSASAAAAVKALEDQWLALQGDLARSRAHPRIPLSLEAWLKLESGVLVPARTKDVSLGGLCLRSLRTDLMIGERVLVEIETADRKSWLRLDAVIAWVAGPLVGVCFEAAAHKQVVPLMHRAMLSAVGGLDEATERLRRDRGE